MIYLLKACRLLFVVFGCLVKYYVITGIFCDVFKCGTMFHKLFSMIIVWLNSCFTCVCFIGNSFWLSFIFCTKVLYTS